MKMIGFMLATFLAVLTHHAIAEEGAGQRVARACAGDFERLCAKRVAMPLAEDFQKGGRIFNCLQEYIPSGRLSRPCGDVIQAGGR